MALTTTASGVSIDESRQIKCESSPPTTPRSLRLERVAQALAQTGSTGTEEPQVRSVPPAAFIR